METSSVGSRTPTGTTSSTASDAFKNVDMDDFLKLMITELQNQDPLSPMDNQQLLQQFSQIREIESNLQLTDTLKSLLMGQNLASAGALIGRTVVGLDGAGEKVTGVVERVSVADGEVRLHVGDSQIDLADVSQILGEEEAAS